MYKVRHVTLYHLSVEWMKTSVLKVSHTFTCSLMVDCRGCNSIYSRLFTWLAYISLWLFIELYSNLSHRMRLLDVLLMNCISLHCFPAGLYWTTYSLVYHICRTPSSSNPGCHSLYPQPILSTSHLIHLPSICPLFFVSLPLTLLLLSFLI